MTQRTIELSCLDRHYTLRVPDGVEAYVAELKHIEGSADPEALVRQALENPIGAPCVEELVKPGQKICIICDDITRPTPTELLAKALLARLDKAGIPDRDIFFVFALGSHRYMTREEMELKLGADIVARYQVMNSEFMDESRMVVVGKSQMGTPIRVLKEIMDADVRIGMGNIVPHGCMGWAGGAKILYPGVTSEDIVSEFHSMQGLSDQVLFGMVDSPVRLSVEEWTKQIGLDYIINTVLTAEGELYQAVAGDYVKAHRAGVAYAKDIFCAEIPWEPDVVVISSHPLGLDMWQCGKALYGPSTVVREGGCMLLLAPCVEGMGPHPESMPYAKLPNGQQLLRERMERGETGEALLSLAVGVSCGRIFARTSVSVISDGLTAEDMKDSPMNWYPERALQQVLEEELAKYPNPKLLVIPIGGETIPLVAGR